MNHAFWHLALNHFPVVGSVFAVILLIVCNIFKLKNIRAAAYILIIFNALLTFFISWTGHEAEHALIKVIEKEIVEKHEALADLAYWIMETGGLLSLIGLWMELKKDGWRKTFSLIVLVVMLLCCYQMFITAHSGGSIRHSEVR